MTTKDDVRQVLHRSLAEIGIPGIAAEIKDGDHTWFTTAGVADLHTGAPRVPGEHFHAGSSGKAFTAATLLALEAEGHLRLDDTVNAHLPGVLDVNGYDGDTITIRHLLSNTSGLFPTGLAPEIGHRYATRSGFDKHRFDTFTTDELLRVAVSQPPVGAPGERFEYANGGFYIAGAIIEKITGNSYADEVHRRVIQPLGLTHTHVRPTTETGYPTPHPRGYSHQFLKDGTDPASVTPENWQSLLEEPGLPPLDVTEFNSSLGHAAGNVVSTTTDMLRFFTALTTGALLPPAQHRQMWTTVSTEGGHWIPRSRYGLGVFELDPQATGGAILRGLGGSFWGSYVFTVGTPDGRHAIAVHTNTEWKTWDLMFNLIEAEFGITVRA
ncbi:serine hydrolase domain-containing protein [Bailinhaonella thermotolerans]|uniref:Class A beta-lactamase-related serine hydrolase n=1 Tax=Bailinhaonella thermotolerans TaxID=1070861 RepID=A0A3A4AY81_9ACTN|nr:serine hydrolase domain-containing protein [Bailinhaonella thermotolerans]RJL35287.1 class A beta-lactamase-related serine hydrolase [Bailinhaonella thermotolerans]